MRRTGLLAPLAAATLFAACSGSTSSTDADAVEVIEVFTNYRGDSAESFRRVLDEFEEATGYRAVHVGTADFANRIRERVEERDMPDIALFPQPGLVRRLAAGGQLASMESFDDAFAQRVEANYPDVLDPVSIDGELFALPWRVDVGSLVWYRPDVFDELGYSVPEDYADLAALASQIELDGLTPWCLTIESFRATGWVGTDWIEDLMLRTQPLDVYDDWSTGDIPFDDDRVRDTFVAWDDLALRPGRHVGTIRTILNTPWTDAGNPMFDDEPGCLLHRQLGQAYRRELPSDLTVGPDGDVDVFVMPGAEADGPDPLLLAGEFAAAFTDEPGVRELMLHLSTPSSGESWAATGGYLSPHAGFDRSVYADDFSARLAELIASAEVLRFDGSDLMPPEVGVGTFWSGIVEFVYSRDLDRTVAMIDDGFPESESPLGAVSDDG